MIPLGAPLSKYDFKQDDIHGLYRSGFNVLDQHNRHRQGGASFEDTWKTWQWWVRDYQFFFGVSEINAWLLWKHYRDNKADLATFRRKLAYQMLNNMMWKADRETMQTRKRAPSPSTAPENMPPDDASAGLRACWLLPHCVMKDKNSNGRCLQCGKSTRYYCKCMETSTHRAWVCVLNALIAFSPTLLACPATAAVRRVHRAQGANKQRV